MKKLIMMLVLFSVMISFNARAAEDDGWVTMDQNDTMIFKVDADSVRYVTLGNDKMATFRSIFLFKTLNGKVIDKNLAKYTHAYFEYVIICNTKQFMFAKSVYYKNKKIMKIGSEDNKSYDIIDGTFINTAYEALCVIPNEKDKL